MSSLLTLILTAILAYYFCFAEPESEEEEEYIARTVLLDIAAIAIVNILGLFSLL